MVYPQFSTTDGQGTVSKSHDNNAKGWDSSLPRPAAGCWMLRIEAEGWMEVGSAHPEPGTDVILEVCAMSLPAPKKRGCASASDDGSDLGVGQSSGCG
jgi:hypothetical protein